LGVFNKSYAFGASVVGNYPLTGSGMKLRIVMVAIILPLLALAAYFASQTITAEQGRLAVATNSAVRANEQITIDNLIDELQKERGYSAGLGFSVVASEVRALAQCASQAAMDIKSLVDESCRHVKSGGDFVDQTGAVLDDI
jgi:hypothetical protein